MRRLSLRRRPEPPPDPATVVRRRRDQRAVLAAIAEQAVEQQHAADVAIRACGTPGTVPDEVGVQLGVLLRVYSRLHHQVEQMDIDPSLRALRRELQGQVSYHLHMLRDAGDLVFSGRPHAQTQRFRDELAEGLGPHAYGLVLLRDRLREPADTTGL